MDAHEITTRLPPLREDEPATLRQDIVAEILDHLQCGLRRELLAQGGDETSAKERVLIRFGDPREVARKLWFQAMWSQIMSQRIVVGSALFSLVVCTILVGLMVWVVQQQQQANAALLEQIVKLIPQPSPTTELPTTRSVHNRSRLKVKVTLNSQDGPPAKGTVIYVSKLRELDSDARTINGQLFFVTDSSGVADCGLTQPGRFEISMGSPSKESMVMNFTIPGEEDHLEQIVIPENPPSMTRIVFRSTELPDELEGNSIGLVMRLRPVGSREFEGHSWVRRGRWPAIPSPLALLSKSPGLQIAPEPDAADVNPSGNDVWNVPIDDVIKHGKWESPDEWRLPAGEYSAQFGLASLVEILPDPYWFDIPNMGTLSNGVWLRITNRFRAEPGKLNEWTIELPDYVSRCIRDPSKIRNAIDNTVYSQGGMGGGGMGGMGGGGGFF